MPDTSKHKKLDKPLFEQLFKTHFVHLSNFAYQFVKDTDSAKDITQKVFINLWENREKIDLQKSIQSYLFTSVRNRCLNFIRDQKKYRSEVLDLETYDFEIPFEEDNIAMSELKEKVAQALNELPEKCRLVFEMSRYKNMKYKDIAEELDVSVKTVEAHMSKALKSLRTNLEDYSYILLVISAWLN
jgi:RNA polymerase sigma-70 factor (ECF subfamily)